MIRNYIKIALRNLIKSKTFSIINITGMTMGLASFFIISIFIWDELKYDRYHEDRERTYRIYNIHQGDEGTTKHLPIVPLVFATTLEKDYPQIESTLRVLDTYGNILMNINDNRFYQQQGIYAEHTIFDMLSIELIEGSEALKGPNEVVLSERVAGAYFEKGDASGKTILIDKVEYTVAGVFKNIPEHSHLQTEVIISLETLFQNWTDERLNNWVWQQFFTYVKIREGHDAADLAVQLPAFSEKYAHPVTKPLGFFYTPYLQRIDDIYLHSSHFEWEIARRGDIFTVYALSAAALFILVIVCVNYINLSTARSLNRLKEVGIRKVIGAHKKQLILQFLGESVWIAMISVLLAGLVAELLLPQLNHYTGKNIQTGFLTEPLSLVLMVSFALVIGILAGTYPAFFASSFNTLAIFTKRSSGRVSSGSIFRKATVIVQFTLSIFLITGMVIVHQQLSFLRDKDLGFDREQVVIMDLTRDMRRNPERLESLKNEWTRHPAIQSITYCFGLPGQIVSGDEIRNKQDKTFAANHIMVDFDYFSTLGLEVVAGRAFDKNFISDPVNAFVINETAVRNLGFGSAEEAIGQSLNWDLWHFDDSVKRGQVIGVVRDFHFKSLRDQLTTTVLHIYPRVYQTMAIKLKLSSAQEVLPFLETSWNDAEPGWPFSYRFLDESFHAMYSSERQLSHLFSFFTTLAIIIACMGLFGLVYYTAAQKVREIGIRKVLGADIMDVVLLINRNFVLLILIGLVIAIPISYYLATGWLENFAYSITPDLWFFALPGLAMLLFAFATVSFQSLKAALANPVDTLKED